MRRVVDRHLVVHAVEGELAVLDAAGPRDHGERAPDARSRRRVTKRGTDEPLLTERDDRRDPASLHRVEHHDQVVTGQRQHGAHRRVRPPCARWCSGSLGRRSPSTARWSARSAPASACSSGSPTTTATRSPRSWPTHLSTCGCSRDDDGVMNRSLADARRRGARREPVHALRRHEQGPSPVVAGGGAARGRRAAGRRGGRCACASSVPRWRPGGSAPTMAVELVNDGPVTVLLELDPR